MSAPNCPSRLRSVTETGSPYWPTCQLRAGHEGSHRRGHFQDVMWSWNDDEAMSGEER